VSSAGLDWVALLPAAKTTVPGGDGPRWRDVWDDDPALARPRRELARALAAAARDLDEAAWARLVEGRGEVAAVARRVARGIRTAPCRPAGERYAGPVAARLDAPTLSAAARGRVLFVTATAGLVASDAPMPDERLPIGASLPPFGRLSTWWRPHVRAALERRLAPGAAVWDLLGGEYAAAVGVPTGCRRVTVRFVLGGRGAPSGTAKQLRGLAARWLAEHGGADPEGALTGFAAEVAGARWRWAGASVGPDGGAVRITGAT
jgi:uncharacterized protein